MVHRGVLVFFAIALIAACGSDDEKDIPVITSNNGNNSTVNNQSANNPNDTGVQNNDSNNVQNNAANNDSNGTNNASNNPPNNTNINDSCPPEARPVYVVEAAADGNFDEQGKLVRFDARELTFTDIGELNCPADAGETPFSMSVDRDANAWVLYSNGELFKVSTEDASCEATSYQPGQNGFSLFGMGFVLDRPNFEDETLYIAGGDGPSGFQAPRMGYLTFPDLTVTGLETIGGWPEMSGTAAAELWAFFPGTNPPRVSRVLPASGEEVEVIPVSGITGQPNAWAFAHWGGDFWLFYKSQSDPSTRVFQVERESQEVTEVITDSGRYIVGAGVSTCAPLIYL